MDSTSLTWDTGPVIHYTDVRYLLSKKTVDDRAINAHVLKQLAHEVGQLGHLPEILEIGAGVGTMVSRLADWGVIANAAYTLVDRDAVSLAAARAHLLKWAPDHELCGDEVKIATPTGELTVRFVHGDAISFCASEESRGHFDLIAANAVLDLMDLEYALPKLFLAAKRASLFWFTINFDGETIFMPLQPEDSLIMELYHRTMDERFTDGRPAGDSKTGRKLLTALPSVGASITSAGSSDWIVFPKESKYEKDEAYFLHHIINTVHRAVEDFPELEALDFERWVQLRHEQVERGELSYIAHQIDVLGCTPHSPTPPE